MLDMNQLQSQHNQGRLIVRSEATQIVLEGQIYGDSFQRGLNLHCSDVQLNRRVHSQAKLEPGIKLILMLKGKISMQLNGEQHAISANDNACLMLASTEQQPCTRAMLATGDQQQIVLSIPQSWFDEVGYSRLPGFQSMAHFCCQHLAHRLWRPDAGVLQIGRALLDSFAGNDHLHQLQRECRTLDLLLAGMAQIGQTPRNTLDQRGEQRVAQLLDLLHSGDADDYSLDQMAQAVGSNATTLQRQFRLKLGMSIFEYVRGIKLESAKQNLSQGMSVTNAALIAGYSGPANFATAFKRQFGISPKDARLC